MSSGWYLLSSSPSNATSRGAKIATRMKKMTITNEVMATLSRLSRSQAICDGDRPERLSVAAAAVARAAESSATSVVEPIVKASARFLRSSIVRVGQRSLARTPHRSLPVATVVATTATPCHTKPPRGTTLRVIDNKSLPTSSPDRRRLSTHDTTEDLTSWTAKPPLGMAAGHPRSRPLSQVHRVASRSSNPRPVGR